MNQTLWKSGGRRLVSLVSLLLGLSLLATSGWAQTDDPTSLEARLVAAPLPPRNPYELAVRLRGADPTFAPAPLVTEPLPLGQSEAFSVIDSGSAVTFDVQATLRLETEHAYWFVQAEYDSATDGRKVEQADLERAAGVFEQVTYPRVREVFGTEPSPGVDGDPHIVFLLGHVPGVSAYFSGADSYPRSVNPRSNERDMIYVNLDAIRPSSPTFDGVLAHEFQHMVHFARCPYQETWVDEGSSELATSIAGFGGRPALSFAFRPEVQLTAWSPINLEVAPHYEAAYLFSRYLADRIGDPKTLHELFTGCARGTAFYEPFIVAHNLAATFDDFVSDWTVANLLNDRGIADGRYSYNGTSVRTRITAQVQPGVPQPSQLPQYSADYLELPTSGTATFNGNPTVAPLPVPPDGGQAMWWSNRADSLDSTLTRAVDLSGLVNATLTFRTWYDLEDHFDFAYLMASTDAGQSWQVLPGRRTVADDRTGNSFGPGWTGNSGRWVDESVDLTPVAGQPILLRFEYLTDQGYNANGFALDNLQIPELGWSDDAESDGDWTANGWLRLDSSLPQHWHLQLVRWTASGPSVQAIPVDASGQATLPLEPGADRYVLVVAPTAARTLDPANYTLTVQ